tara:strand:+ start:747 stop:926 length:180 start_codon:yes stop_codon:yes gene_type:complete
MKKATGNKLYSNRLEAIREAAYAIDKEIRTDKEYERFCDVDTITRIIDTLIQENKNGNV